MIHDTLIYKFETKWDYIEHFNEVPKGAIVILLDENKILIAGEKFEMVRSTDAFAKSSEFTGKIRFLTNDGMIVGSAAMINDPEARYRNEKNNPRSLGDWDGTDSVKLEQTV